MTKQETIRKLAHKLKQAGVDKETGVTLSLMVRRPRGAEQLMAWIEQNPKAAHEEIFDKAREIHKATMTEERKSKERCI